MSDIQEEKWNENVEKCSGCGIEWKKIGKQCPVCYAPSEQHEMTKEDALKIIQDFADAGGNLFIDGCTGLSDKNLILIDRDCQILLAKTNGA